MVRSLERLFTSLLVCSLLAGLSIPSRAETGDSEEEPLELVTGPHYPPFAADNLPHKGLAPFLISRIMESGNRKVAVDLRPWKRAYRDSLGGEYDGVLPYIESEARQDDYLFSAPVFKVDAFAYVAADSDIDAQSLDELEGLTYCNPVGFTDSRVLKDLRADGKIARFTASNLNNCFRMLIAGHVDFVKINHYVARFILAQLDLPEDSIRRLPFVVENASLHLMVPKNRPGAEALIDEFNALFKEMKESGQIETLKENYLEQLEI